MRLAERVGTNIITWQGTADSQLVTVAELQGADILSDPIALIEDLVLFDRPVFQVKGIGLTGGSATTGMEVRACSGFAATDDFKHGGNQLLYVSHPAETNPATNGALSLTGMTDGDDANREFLVGHRVANSAVSTMRCYMPYIQLRLDNVTGGGDYTAGSFQVTVMRLRD